MFIKAITKQNKVEKEFLKIKQDFEGKTKQQQKQLLKFMKNYSYDNNDFFLKFDLDLKGNEIFQIIPYSNNETKCIMIYEKENGIDIFIKDYKNYI